MAFIVALFISALIVLDFIVGGKIGFKKVVLCLLANRIGKWLVIAGAISLITALILISAGGWSISDIIEQEKKMVELCPWCMNAA